MRIKHLILLTFLYSISSNAQDTTKVLFIGNSITYFNNMPQTFESIANSKGDPTEVTMYAPGGTGFINHVNDPNVFNYFQQEQWDYVVLQPGSNESPGYSEPINQTLARARILKDSILFYSPCAKILYYEISYGVWGNTSANLNSYNNTMDLIRSNLEYLSDSTKLFFTPAGEVMRAAWNNNQTKMLWGGNGDIHPNAKGSYMIACAFYAAIFQKSSFGTYIISTLTQIEASNYQQLADTIVLNNLSDWRINTYNQYTDFNYSVNQSIVTFNNTSQNVDSLSWDFGDGGTSNNLAITHNYISSGTFIVTLTTYKGECLESKTKIISILTVGIDKHNDKSRINISPNPFTDKILIEGYTIKDISIFNLSGQDFSNQISFIYTAKGMEINTSNLPSGGYILKTKSFANFIYK